MYEAGDSRLYDCKKSTCIEHDSSIQLVLFIYNMIMKNTFQLSTTSSFNELLRQKDVFYKNKFSSYLFLNEYVHLIKTLLLVSRKQLKLAGNHKRDLHYTKLCTIHGLTNFKMLITEDEYVPMEEEQEIREQKTLPMIDFKGSFCKY